MRLTRDGEDTKLALVIAASAAVLGFDFGRWVLATNDDTRFPVLARSALVDGHWLLPRLNGVPHLNKPPLFAWFIAIVSWPAGSVTQWTVAAASLLAALALALATYWVGRRLYEPGAARRAVLILVTTYGIFSMGRVPLPDVALCAAMTAAVGAYLAADLDGRRGALIWFYGLLGVAFWIKGLPGLLPLLAILLHARMAHGRSGPRRLLSLPGIALLVALLLPWPILATRADAGRFGEVIVVTDILLWYFRGRGWSWGLIGEPLAQAVTVLLPWVVALPFAIRESLASAAPERTRRGQLLLLLWMAATLVLTGLSYQQRMRYYVPLCAPAALLVAGWRPRLPALAGGRAFAAAWLAAALGLGLWQTSELGRHNARTSMAGGLDILREAGDPLYAVDAPELVFAFYLDRPVVALNSYAQFRQLPRIGYAHLLISPRSLPPIDGQEERQVGSARVNGREVVILRAAPPH